MGRRGKLVDRQPPSKTGIPVSCQVCSAVWKKRKDSLKIWAGLCRSCAMKKVASRPGVKERLRQNGIKVMAKVGRLPHYAGRNYRSGPANHKWRGGITPEIMRIRNSSEMKLWRVSVFKRDGFTCTLCGQRGGDLHADHIKPFSLYPGERFLLENGRTLCVACHRAYGACVSDGKITREPTMEKVG